MSHWGEIEGNEESIVVKQSFPMSRTDSQRNIENKLIEFQNNEQSYIGSDPYNFF